MPSLFQPGFPPLINSLPVARHSVAVDSSFWKPKFAAVGRAAVWASIFGASPSIRISRDRLLRFAYPNPEQKCAEILLWGYPTDMRGIVSRLLPHLTVLSTCAVAVAPWPAYFKVFPNGVGISTITKFAYFHGVSFGGLDALILDQRLINNTANWVQVAIPGLTYQTAFSLYPSYLAVMHRTAADPVLACAPDQLEFFLFELGGSF